MKTFADFKRALTTPGVKLLGVRHDRIGEGNPEWRARFFAKRGVAKVQTNAVKLDDNSWLYFHKAADYSFDGDVVTCKLDDAGTALAYRVILPS